MVILVLFGMAAPASAAPSGSVTEFKILVTDDGTEPADLDGAKDNGLVAVGSAVTMLWSISARNLDAGTFTQTLPEGWSWDTSSLVALTSQSSVYHSSYTVSGPTLTATISVPNASIVNIPGLRATVASTARNGSTYTPTVTYTDSAGTSTGSATPVTVVGAYQIGASIIGAGSARATGTHDFGNGPVDAYCGQLSTDILNPVAIGALSGTPDAVVAHVQLTGLLPSDVTVGVCDATEGRTVTITSYDPETGALVLTLDGSRLPANDTARADVRDAVSLWYPASLVTQTAQQTVVNGTIDPITVGGQPSEGSTTVDGTVTVAAPGAPVPPQRQIVAASASTTSYALTSGTAPVLPLSFSGTSPSGGWRQVASGNSDTGIAKDAVAVHVSTLVPPYLTTGTQRTEPITDLVAYDFWDPAIGQIIDTSGSVQLILDGRPIASPAYTIEYTAGTDSSGPWMPSIDAAGGTGQVRGVKITSSSVLGLGNISKLSLSVAQNVVGDYGQRLVNDFSWSSNEIAPAQATGTSVRILFANTSVTATADPPAIVSGNAIAYTFTPAVCATFGGDMASPGTNLRVQVALSSVITQVNSDAAVAAGWTLLSFIPADVGTDGMPGTRDDVRGPVLVFTMPSTTIPPNGCATIPDITLDTMTSLKAPDAGTTIPATVQVSMDQAAPSTGSALVNITQSNTLSMDGTVVTPRLQPSDRTVSWTTDWYNFTSSAVTGGAYVLDVLPRNSDDRGTATSASLQLVGATLLGQAATNGAELQYTTTDRAAIGPVPGDAATWNPVTSSTDLSAVTALRVFLPTMLSGSFGGLKITMSANGHSAGDVFVNDAHASFATNSTTLQSPAYQARAIAATIEGTVWKDLDRDGDHQDSEPGIAGVTVTLKDADGIVATTMTDERGAYAFGNLDGGTFTAIVDQGTVSARKSEQTHGPGTHLDNSSGPVVLAPGGSLSSLDYGYAFSAPALALEKTAVLADAATGVVGDRIQYAFAITNTGDATLQNVQLTDPLPGLGAVTFTDWPGPAGVLEPGQSVRAAAGYVVRQSDVDAGSVVNTATASGTTADGDRADATASATAALTRESALTLSKAGKLSSQGTLRPGDTVDFTLTVANTGTTTLTGVAIQDPLPGLSALDYGTWPSGSAGTLLPGESITAVTILTLTQADIDAGAVINVATASGTGPDKGVGGQGAATVQLPHTASIDLTEQGHLAAGESVQTGTYAEFDYTVTNTGNTTLTITSLTDAVGGEAALDADAGTGIVLAPGDRVTFTGRHSLTRDDLDAGALIDRSVVKAITPAGDTVTDDATATVEIPRAPETITAAPGGTEPRQEAGDAGPGSGGPFEAVLAHTGSDVVKVAVLAVALAGLGGVFLLLALAIRLRRRS